MRKTALFVWLVLVPALALSQNISVDDETCLACHDDLEATVVRGPYALDSLHTMPGANVVCVSCHSGGEIHIEDPSVNNISNPARLRGDAARDVCFECHQSHSTMDNYGFDIHTELQLSCSSCHRVHGGNRHLLLADDAAFCLKCHQEMKSAFARRSQHPVGQQNITCLSCHRFVRRSDQWPDIEFNRICQDCHPEQAGPFPFEHPAVNGYALEGSGCLQCHDPHGSENDRLLRQPGEQLCRNCHLEPIGHRLLPVLHGPVRDIDNCYACHSEVHGSFTSHKLLDPNLQSRLGSSQDCSRCHDLTE